MSIPTNILGDSGNSADVDSSKRLKVVTQGGAGGTSMVDDSAFTPAVDSVTPVGLVFDDAAPDSVNEGDVGAQRMSANRSAHVVLRDVDGNERGLKINVNGRAEVSIEEDNVGIGGGTEYAVDAVLGATPTGKLALAKRDDALGGLTPIEGDAVELRVDANGALWVIPSGTVIVDGSGVTQPVSGTETNSGAIKTAVELIDNAISGSEMQVDVVAPLPAGTNAIGKLSANSGVDIGDVDVASQPADIFVAEAGALGKGVLLQGDDGTDRKNVNVDATTGNIQVDVTNTITETNSAAILADTANMDTNLGALAGVVAGSEIQADILTVPAPLNLIGGGTEAAALRVTLANNSTGVLSVDDNGGSMTVDGTFWQATQPISHAALTELAAAINASNQMDVNIAASGVTVPVDLGANNDVQGDVAHDAVDSGNPTKVGYRAIAHGTNPTAVAAADRTDGYANRAGVPFVIGGHPNIISLEARYTAVQTDAAIVTITGGLKIVVTNIGAVCDNANSVDVAVRIGFGAVNTPTTTGVILTHGGIAAGSGYDRGSGAGMLGVGADGEDLRITSEVPTGGDLRILVSYYTVES